MIKMHSLLASSSAIAFIMIAAPSMALEPSKTENNSWDNKSLSPDERAIAAVSAMTQEEKLTLVFGYYSNEAPWMTRGTRRFEAPKDGLPFSAGYVPGIPRLKIPAQWQTDAGVGVATQLTKTPRLRTALPSGIAIAASWNPETALKGGQMIGNEAFLSGFNIHLAGGINLTREPRNGRNFEYAGEDPLLAGVIVGNEIKGIQTNHIISTIKHFAFNAQETNRNHIDVKIGEQAAMQSDLLAFVIANEIGTPGSVMCAYNRVNGAYSCENKWLLNDILKTDWNFKGYVMSDWGGTHSTIPAANFGLDQESGWGFDRSPYFHDALEEAVNNGHVSKERLDDMAHRILWAMFANGLIDNPVNGDQSAKIDYKNHAQITQSAAEESIVLLKNQGLLPLSKNAKKITIIGGHADFGVLSGGGSSQVFATGYQTFKEPLGDAIFYQSSPMKALAAKTTANIIYNDGSDLKAAANAAKDADIVIIFATQWTAEGLDTPNLNLPGQQDALINTISGANKNTIVVLQTGGPVIMPWLNKVGAVIEAWYPGTSGGEAIARVLTGEVNPSGRLPVTFPQSIEQLPRTKIDGDRKLDETKNPHPHTDYDIEGAAVGYKWADKNGLKPLFPFGYGLSYSKFTTNNLNATAKDNSISISAVVKNTGKVSGSAVTQIYVAPVGDYAWEAPKRLAAFTKTNLQPNEALPINLNIDLRLLSVYDANSKTWQIRAGDYKIMVGDNSDKITATTTIHLGQKTFSASKK